MLQPKPREIDTRKLRRLLLARARLFAHVRQLTDQFIELRDEASRLQGRIADIKRQGLFKSSPTDDQHLTDIRDEIAQTSAARDAASREADVYGYVDDLVSYARSLGYHVDTVGCTVRSPAKPDTRTGAPPGNYLPTGIGGSATRK